VANFCGHSSFVLTKRRRIVRFSRYQLFRIG